MYSLITTTTPTKKEAKKLAKALLSGHIVGCVQISKVESHYIWNKKICAKKEFLLSVKTSAKNVAKAQSLICKNHSYSIPEFVVFEMDSLESAYQKWLDSTLVSISPKPKATPKKSTPAKSAKNAKKS